MSARARSVAAWSALGLCIAFAVAGAVVAAAFTPTPFEWSGIGFIIGVMGAPTFGALILSRAPNRVGWLLIVVGLGGTLAIVLGSMADSNVEAGWMVWVAWVANWVWPFSLGSLILILQLFPDGRPLTPRWRWLVGLTLLAVGLLVIGSAFGPGRLGDYERYTNPVGLEALRGSWVSADVNIGWALIIPSVLGSAASLVVRYRRSRGERRQQLKWLSYAAVLFGLGWVGVVVSYEAFGSDLVGQILFASGMIAVPVAVGIAILKYRLYDIDLVINKTMVYGALAAFITAVYVAIVVGVGALIGSGDEPNLALSIAATAVVALSFQPVRERVQRVANRLVYGERATPYQVMAGFSDRVANAISVEDVLPRMAETAARGVGAAATRVSVFLSEGDRHAVWPEDAEASHGFDRTITVRDRGEAVGEIALRKPAGEAFTSSDERLLEDLAAQAGLALRNVRLTAELERRVEETSALAGDLAESRRRILSARDEERRRLERRVHGGPQRRLAVMNDRLREIDEALDDPARATELLEALGMETAGTLDVLRELARGIFPPLLSDQGLAPALEAQARKLDRAVEISPELVGVRLSAEAEAAAYFCSALLLEEANPAAVLSAALEGGSVVLSLPGGVSEETLRRVRDRAEALGGSLETGAAVQARIPVGDQPELAAAQASSSRSGSNSDLGM